MIVDQIDQDDIRGRQVAQFIVEDESQERVEPPPGNIASECQRQLFQTGRVPVSITTRIKMRREGTREDGIMVVSEESAKVDGEVDGLEPSESSCWAMCRVDLQRMNRHRDPSIADGSDDDRPHQRRQYGREGVGEAPGWVIT